MYKSPSVNIVLVTVGLLNYKKQDSLMGQLGPDVVTTAVEGAQLTVMGPKISGGAPGMDISVTMATIAVLVAFSRYMCSRWRSVKLTPQV